MREKAGLQINQVVSDVIQNLLETPPIVVAFYTTQPLFTPHVIVSHLACGFELHRDGYAR